MKLPSINYYWQIQDGGIQDGGIQDGGIQDGGIQDGGIQDGWLELKTAIGISVTPQPR